MTSIQIVFNLLIIVWMYVYILSLYILQLINNNLINYAYIKISST